VKAGRLERLQHRISELENEVAQAMLGTIQRGLVEGVSKKDEREQDVHKIIEKIKEHLQKKGIQATVYGRTKHFYSIYRKMLVRNKKFEEIYDLYAIRIICGSEEECYAVLGIIHSIYHPLPDRLKDYIANPKHNMYQSIHTQIVVDGKPVEVQIRTKDMHIAAEDGIAAHWRFKGTDRDKKFDQKIVWLKQILS
jgi:GTP pyrophosphokinase